MCDGHDHTPAQPTPAGTNTYPTGLTRRGLLQVGAALAGGLGLTPATRALAAPRTAAVPPPSPSGLRTWRTAMHVHASLSEKTGSVASQVTQAAAAGFDVLHLSEHDARAYKIGFRTAYDFTRDERQYGGAWNVVRAGDVGTVVTPVDGLVTSPVSPTPTADGGPAGALRIRLSARAGATASRCWSLANGFTAGSTGTRANWNGSIVGDRYAVDVLPAVSGRDGWGDVYVTLSHHPATAGRPAGVRRLHYRLRTDVVTRRRSVQGAVGVVDVPVRPGVWTTVDLDLVTDAAALWPAEDPRDHALNGTQFWATARDGGTADVYFAALRRTPQGAYDPVGLQRSLLDGAAGLAPGLRTHAGLEYSYDDAVHINGFGGRPGRFDYGQLANRSSRPLYPDFGPGLSRALVSWIHAGGGLASLNHLFGFTVHATRGAAQQDAATRDVVLRLLADRAAGADLVEVGYRQRNGYTLDHQLQVFDALIRNGIWVTGNGTSDDHTGVGWTTQTNRAYTSTWAATADDGDQLTALAAGRAFVGFLGDFAGTLDLHLDEGPMGSVSVSSKRQRRLRIDVSGLPDGGAVELVQVVVDHAGTADPTAGSRVVRRLGAADLAGTGLQVDTSRSTAYRVNVVDRSGQVVAFSQPCWSLTERPANPIPALRAAPDTVPG